MLLLVLDLVGCADVLNACRAPWLMKTTIPPILQYPVKDGAFEFVSGLVSMFYAPSFAGQFWGLLEVAKIFLLGGPPKKAPAKGEKEKRSKDT
jgi:hypothetical protein